MAKTDRNCAKFAAGAAVALICLMLPTSAALAGANPVPAVVELAAGRYISGSDARERESAYRLDEKAYGHSVTRQQGWYDDEAPRNEQQSPGFAITRSPITNAQYAAFVKATGHPAPDVDARTWRGYGLIHPFARTRRHAWQNRRPPAGRSDHPVVLVSLADARAYAAWLSRKTGQSWRLPREAEWERAARGDDGRIFPWGNAYEPDRLNSHDAGPFDTEPVGHHPAGNSPHGLVDPAGQVFEWTATSAGKNRHLVKGGSWDDKGCGVCRPAARHGRPDDLKHILIGFRLIRE